MSQRRIGPKMRQVAWYVSRNPGCTKRAAALFVGPSSAYGYETVERAISAGLIEFRPHPKRADWYALYPVQESEADTQPRD